MTIERFRELLFIIGPGVPVVDRDTFPIVIDNDGIWTVDFEHSVPGEIEFRTHETEEAAKTYGAEHGYGQSLLVGHKGK